MWKIILQKINESTLDHLGKESSARLSSYIILIQILIIGLIFIGIDLTNGVICWNKGEVYEIPTAHIIIFGMILSHHLVLLGLKKGSESTSYPSLEKKYENNNRNKHKEEKIDCEVEDFFDQEENCDYSNESEEDIYNNRPQNKKRHNTKFNRFDNPDL